MTMWDMISNIASIATIVLFVIYFVGRTITIFAQVDVCCDEVLFCNVGQAEEKFNIIENWGDIGDAEEELLSVVVLTSKQGIRKIKITRIGYDENLNYCRKNSKLLYAKDFLNIGESVVFTTYLPEVIPIYKLEFRTLDFKKVSLEILDNLKSGVASEMLVAKHTIKSVLYHLFR